MVGCYSYEITKRELDEIETLLPDIILLTGGTDGGDKKVIIHNARVLANYKRPGTIILVAGNKTAYDEIKEIFQKRGREVIFTGNVMPEIGRLDVGSCNKKIREIFIQRIIEAKGIAKAKKIVSNILMPTPSAVSNAARLISEGYGGVEGLGELFVIDVGGATTDVHSVAEGSPSTGAVNLRGLPEPYVKRTVEGDLGLRFNIERLIEVLEEKDVPSAVTCMARKFSEQGCFPLDEEGMNCHTLLSRLAVEVATDRHAGRIDVRYGPTGKILVQYGKDFTGIQCIIGTGGPIVFSRHPDEILMGAMSRQDAPQLLKPREPNLYVDAEYVLYAGGLMSQVEPEKALGFMKKYLKTLPHHHMLSEGHYLLRRYDRIKE